MYLTAGQFKGRKVEVPKSARPTLSKVRESVFNVLMSFDFEKEEGITFFEMFAGSGIMGLEAASRGYKVKGCEINKKAIQIIKNNYKSLGLVSGIILCDVFKYLSDERYDIIYIDPPWEFEYISIIKKASCLVKKRGIIIIEYDKIKKININELIIKSQCPLELVKEKEYGRVCLAFLRLM